MRAALVIGLAALISLSFVLALAPSVRAVDPAIDVSGCYSNRYPLSEGFEADKACNGNDLADQWLTVGSPPVYIVMNLTQGPFTVSAVAIFVGNYNNAGTIDVWTGTEWFTKANFTDPENNSNVTTTLDNPYTTTMLRIYWPVSGNGGVIGAAEITPFGVPAPTPCLDNALVGLVSLVFLALGFFVLWFVLGAFGIIDTEGEGLSGGGFASLEFIGAIIAVVIAVPILIALFTYLQAGC